MALGMTRSLGGLTSPLMKTPAQLQSERFRKETEANQRVAQDRLAQQEATRNQLSSQRTASDIAHQMLSSPDTQRTSTGTQFEVSSPGGGISGSRGGLAIGGGIFPDISQFTTQLKQNAPQVAAPQRVAPPAVPDLSSGFAQAKDVSGRVGNKAIEALRNMMTRRGISDSGLAVEGEADILGQVARQQAEGEYETARTNSARQWEANQMGYQGDLSQNSMGYQGQVAQRGQDLNWILSMLSRLY